MEVWEDDHLSPIIFIKRNLKIAKIKEKNKRLKPKFEQEYIEGRWKGEKLKDHVNFINKLLSYSFSG